MTTYAEDEESVEDGSPREIVTIAINGTDTYRHTSADRDMVVGGLLYTAIALDRSETAITMPGEEKDLTLTLPVDHALARRFTQQNQPPKKVTVTVRCQQTGGELQTIWVGDITSMQIDESVARFRVPSRAGEYMLRSVPNALVSRTCPHMLYGSMCRVSRDGAAPTSAMAVIERFQ